MPDPTKRFSDRVENYARYRPGYPAELYEVLCLRAGLAADDAVADLGSGTGLLSQLFLDNGHTVYAVEPNAEMRSAAEHAFANQPSFISIDGRAEDTGLPNASVDFIAAGQAFHWFDAATTKAEAERILKPGGQVALIWNRRDVDGSDFQREYEQLLERFGTDFLQVDQQRTITDEKLDAFFAPHRPGKATLPNVQVLDLAGLRGRLLSSSYTPRPEDPGYGDMLDALEQLFVRHEREGFVRFEYQTTAYFGQVA